MAADRASVERNVYASNRTFRALSPYGNNYDMLISGSVFAILPVIIIFLFFQNTSFPDSQ